MITKDWGDEGTKENHDVEGYSQKAWYETTTGRCVPSTNEPLIQMEREPYHVYCDM